MRQLFVTFVECTGYETEHSILFFYLQISDCQQEINFLVKYTNFSWFIQQFVVHLQWVILPTEPKADTPQKRNNAMTTKVSFIDPMQVKVETEDGCTYILGHTNDANFLIEKQGDGRYSRCVAALFDQYYDRHGSAQSIGVIAGCMQNNKLYPFSWVRLDKDKERERIGERIKELRKEQRLDAKELALRAGIDAGNLSKIERGQFSVGIDILNKIAAALNMRVDFVPINEGHGLTPHGEPPMYGDTHAPQNIPFGSD